MMWIIELILFLKELLCSLFKRIIRYLKRLLYLPFDLIYIVIFVVIGLIIRFKKYIFFISFVLLLRLVLSNTYYKSIDGIRRWTYVNESPISHYLYILLLALSPLIATILSNFFNNKQGSMSKNSIDGDKSSYTTSLSEAEIAAKNRNIEKMLKEISIMNREREMVENRDKF